MGNGSASHFPVGAERPGWVLGRNTEVGKRTDSGGRLKRVVQFKRNVSDTGIVPRSLAKKEEVTTQWSL